MSSENIVAKTNAKSRAPARKNIMSQLKCLSENYTMQELSAAQTLREIVPEFYPQGKILYNGHIIETNNN